MLNPYIVPPHLIPAHTPEGPRKLKARFSRAVEHAFTVDEMSSSLSMPYDPERWMHHFFDFADGVRLIVSREHSSFLAFPFIHVSASTCAGSYAFYLRRNGSIGHKDFVQLALRRFRELSGYLDEPFDAEIEEDTVPHFYFREEP